MEEKHFLVVHTFTTDEKRKQSLTPPEKRNPSSKRKTEREWAEATSGGKYARNMQKWIGNDEFLFCHWVAQSEQDVYRQLEENGVVMMNSYIVTGSRKANKMFIGNLKNGILRGESSIQWFKKYINSCRVTGNPKRF